MACIF